MLLSLNWLKEFVEIPKAVTPEELGRKLTLHTVEVEKVEYQADKYKNIVVGKILEVKPHPNADRLRLALVDAGGDKLEIVCGAPNIESGQFVPVALVGAVLPNGLEIKSAEIRGIKSNGMLCAEAELGLGEDHDGIMILENVITPKFFLSPLAKGGRGVKVGQSFSDYLNLNDVIFEVDNKSITHRADLWSHYGLARDISAFLNCEFKEYEAHMPLFTKGVAKIKVEVKDFFLCPRYLAVGLENLKIAPSPKWLADRLVSCGLRPINNIVDITNYVMLELGQPLHAFDKNFIDKIIVRRAHSGETIKTLDGQTRKLESDMLVIADEKKPVAIAGVMGGTDSEISERTTSIIIEAANFNFTSVRQTAQKLGLRTEASIRFEKGLDPGLSWLGLARAVELILKICPGARLAGKLIDVKRYKLKQGPIKLDLNWLNQFIGHEFSVGQVKQILERLGFTVKGAKRLLNVTIPSWRAVHDVSLREDLAEEIARIYGYNKIKPVLPKIDLTPPLANAPKILEWRVKNILSVGAGLSEVYNYSFISAEALDKLKIERTLAIKLANPLSQDLAWLRPSLIPGLVENIKTNQAAEAEIGIYEIGNIFLNRPGDIIKDDTGRENLFWQEKNLTIALAGAEATGLFRRLKGILQYLLSSLNLTVSFESAAMAPISTGSPLAAWAESLAVADCLVGDKIIGRAAIVEKNISRAFGLKKSAAIGEIDFKKLNELIEKRPVKQYKEPPKYPAVSRDLALVANEEILYNNIRREIINFSDLIKQAELFDVYQNETIGQGKKSLAFHIIYQAERTLRSEEVDEVQEKLIKHLEKELGAKIRNF